MNNVLVHTTFLGGKSGVDMALGHSTAKFIDGILTVENETITDIYDYIEIVE